MQAQASLGSSLSKLNKYANQTRSSRPFAVRASSSEPQLSKPVIKPAAPTPAAAAPATPASAAEPVVTLEYQRQQAKAIREYFIAQKEEAMLGQAKVFGWTRKNEINNGRWVMMGIVVGLMTEYATGVSFPDQIRLMLSYLGIADVYE